jgi:hypothetical protein
MNNEVGDTIGQALHIGMVVDIQVTLFKYILDEFQMEAHFDGEIDIE